MYRSSIPPRNAGGTTLFNYFLILTWWKCLSSRFSLVLWFLYKKPYLIYKQNGKITTPAVFKNRFPGNYILV